MVRLVNAGDEPGDEAASSSERRDLVRRLAEEVEPSSTIVSATARDDPALALVADPEAARSASDAAAAAAERLRRLSSIVQSLSEEEWRPPRRPRDVEVSEGPSWSVKDSAPAEIGRRPLIVELDDDDDGSTAATDPSSDDATTPSNSNDVDVLSLGTVAALTAAAYCRGAELHGAGGLPGGLPQRRKKPRARCCEIRSAPAASVVKVPPKKIWTTPRESYWPGVWARRRLYSPTVWLWNPSHGGVMKSTRVTNARRAPSRLSSPLR